MPQRVCTCGHRANALPWRPNLIKTLKAGCRHGRMVPLHPVGSCKPRTCPSSVNISCDSCTFPDVHCADYIPDAPSHSFKRASGAGKKQQECVWGVYSQPQEKLDFLIVSLPPLHAAGKRQPRAQNRARRGIAVCTPSWGQPDRTTSTEQAKARLCPLSLHSAHCRDGGHSSGEGLLTILREPPNSHCRA